MKKRRGTTADVAGVVFTHADRQVYAELGTTKEELARYYLRVAPLLLPGIEDRPLAVLRCPRGREGACFYQKHFRSSPPAGVKLVAIEESAGVGTYAAVTDPVGLVWLVQLGALELHAWLARAGRLECPIELVIDLDPADDVVWSRMRAAAFEVRERLRDRNLTSFVRTTGGKGLHVVVPLAPIHTWKDVRSFAKALSFEMQADSPSEFIARANKDLRHGKIYVDYLRNGRGATAIANYSTRARENAPIATPLGWRELPRVRSSSHYRLANIRRRISPRQDPVWPDFELLGQRLPT